MDEKLEKLRDVMRTEGFNALVIRKSLFNFKCIKQNI